MSECTNKNLVGQSILTKVLALVPKSKFKISKFNTFNKKISKDDTYYGLILPTFLSIVWI